MPPMSSQGCEPVSRDGRRRPSVGVARCDGLAAADRRQCVRSGLYHRETPMPSGLIRTSQATAWVTLLLVGGAVAQTQPPPPPVKDAVDTYFGVQVHDPYRYLESAKDPEVVAWMKSQADYTRTVLDRVPQRSALLAEIEKYGDAGTA